MAKSKCCKATVTIMGGKTRGCTNWYECGKCGEACDVMPKTTKGDGMERRAERFVKQYEDSDIPHEVVCASLTRLLRKVAREAEARGYEHGYQEGVKHDD